MPNVRINITIDDQLLARVDAFAQSHGFTRSGLMATAADTYMEAADKAPIARDQLSELFGIISDAFRAGTSTAELEQRTAALEQKLEAMR